MNEFSKEIQSLIKIEGLDDLSNFFSDCKTFEEIPLFSRYDHISFLSSLSFNEKNKILIKKCIELIAACKSVKANYIKEEDEDEYFICITITDWDDYEEINCLTPNIFFSRRKKWLLSNLNLISSQTIEENIIREYLCALNIHGFSVLISNGFMDNKRVYLISD